jgi:hypothetical protein
MDPVRDRSKDRDIGALASSGLKTTTPRAEHTSTLAAFAFRDFRVFWAGFVITNVSSYMQAFALGWLVVQLAIADGAPERAPLYLGLVAVARAVPGLTLGLFGGVLADRRDRRALLIATQVSYVAIGTALAVLVLSGVINLGWVLAFSVLMAATGSFYHPTRIALLPRLVGETHLMSAYGMNVLALNIGTLLGPLVGGALIAPTGIGGVLLASACLYAISTVIYLFLAPRPAAADARRAHVLASLIEGLRYVRDAPAVRWLIVLFAATTVLARPYGDLLPAFARSIGTDAIGLAQMGACLGVGSLFAGFFTASIGGLRRRGLAVVVAVVATGVALAALGAQTALLPSFVFIVVLSFCLMTASGTVGAVLQMETPDSMRGRVIGVQQLLIEGGMPVGGLMLGSLGTAIGIGPAFAAGGAVLAATAIGIALLVPSLRRIDADRPGVEVRDSAHA